MSIFVLAYNLVKLHLAFKILWKKVFDVLLVDYYDVLQGIFEPLVMVNIMFFTDGEEGLHYSRSMSSIV